MELLLILAAGFAIGMLTWPIRRQLGGQGIEIRAAWAFIFACIWPLLVIGAAWAAITRWRARH